MRSISVLTAVACSLVLFGCGGGGGGDDGGTATPPPVATKAGGIWGGTADSSGMSLNFAGVITEDGQGRFVDENGTQYVVETLSGTNGSISLEFTAIAQSGFTFIDGSTVSTGSLTGTVAERTSINGNYSLATGESGSVSLAYDSVYDRDSALDKLTGMWEEEFGIVTFDPDGSFFEQDSFGCVYDGQASIIDSQFNAYALSMTVSSCGPDADGQYSGFGVLTDTSATDDTFVIQMDNGNLIFTTAITRL